MVELTLNLLIPYKICQNCLKHIIGIVALTQMHDQNMEESKESGIHVGENVETVEEVLETKYACEFGCYTKTANRS